jgi:hypothetical protein
MSASAVSSLAGVNEHTAQTLGPNSNRYLKRMSRSLRPSSNLMGATMESGLQLAVPQAQPDPPPLPVGVAVGSDLSASVLQNGRPRLIPIGSGSFPSTRGDLRPLRLDDHRRRHVPLNAVRRRHDRDLRDTRMLQQRVLDLERTNVLAAGVEHVVGAALNPTAPTGVDIRESCGVF